MRWGPCPFKSQENEQLYILMKHTVMFAKRVDIGSTYRPSVCHMLATRHAMLQQTHPAYSMIVNALTEPH